MANAEVAKALGMTAAMYDRRMPPEAAQLFADDLDGFPPALVLASLARCRKELRTFPTVADIIARIDDSRPGPEEAWAMVPKDESASIVWTPEMRDAFAVARPLIGQDDVAARMAFLESYRKLCSEARSVGAPATWEPSLGHNPAGRVHALTVAVEKGRLTQSHAQALLPDATLAPASPLLTGPVEAPSVDGLARLAAIRARLTQAMPDGDE